MIDDAVDAAAFEAWTSITAALVRTKDELDRPC